MSGRILLIGKTGQVGSELAFRLLPRYELTALGKAELDLANPADIREAVARARPAVIINCAAYTRVDEAESHENLAFEINATAPAVLAEEARKIGAALIHYSTDYVFDGEKRTPYLETDSTNPISAYGRSKLAGEQAIQTAGIPHLILRTEWVYARSGRNFLLTILRLATERSELRIVNDQFGAPTTNLQIAAATAKILEAVQADPSKIKERSGIYHFTAQGETTWFEFAKTILETCASDPPSDDWYRVATNGRAIAAERIVPIKTAEYPTPARRPAYSVLSNERLRATFGFQLPDWREQLREILGSARG